MNNDDAIYTRDLAADIVELFENILDEHNIKIPSPEDDEREEDNEAKLYGSTYYDLLDYAEYILIGVAKRAQAGAKIITDTFGG